ncbi:permease [Salinicoccus roseus]|uniref:permease n=1 Tax=Salinicoccus roseus TaxID=45670 RepID=UPI00230097CF|nr:permease [Salinicoccus roseus]
MAYLYPQFIQKDERMKLIRQKGVMASFVAMVIYFILFTTALQFNWIDAPVYYLFQIFGALMISTVFISLVIYARLY